MRSFIESVMNMVSEWTEMCMNEQIYVHSCVCTYICIRRISSNRIQLQFSLSWCIEGLKKNEKHNHTSGPNHTLFCVTVKWICLTFSPSRYFNGLIFIFHSMVCKKDICGEELNRELEEVAFVFIKSWHLVAKLVCTYEQWIWFF